MHVISVKKLRLFWETHPDAEQALRAWYAVAKHARWRTPADIKVGFRSASFVGNSRVIFNIKGNVYRLVVIVEYQRDVVFVRFVGTHQEYDRIDPETV